MNHGFYEECKELLEGDWIVVTAESKPNEWRRETIFKKIIVRKAQMGG
jgi:hypothetical protein